MANAGAQAQTRSVPFFSCSRSFEQQWPSLEPLLQDIVSRGRYCQDAVVDRF